MLRYSGVPKEHPDVNDMTTSASIESSMERSQSILSSSALNWYALRITYGRAGVPQFGGDREFHPHALRIYH